MRSTSSPTKATKINCGIHEKYLIILWFVPVGILVHGNFKKLPLSIEGSNIES